MRRPAALPALPALLALVALSVAGAALLRADRSSPPHALEPAALPAPSGAPDHISLRDLPLSDVKGAGALLMGRPEGLYWISGRDEREGAAQGAAGGPVALMAHGYESGGYEWIYALHEGAARWGGVWFARWDWRRCPREAGAHLLARLEGLSRAAPHRPIIALGHSYGGVALALAARAYEGAAPLTAHIIAAPLAGHPALEARCPPPSIDEQLRAPLSPRAALLTGGARLVQWRTRPDLDGAFSSLARDPQPTDALPLTARDLGREYRGQRLGHNWSISAVIDRLLAEERAGSSESP